jgi:AcrR family transcriptional regulator
MAAPTSLASPPPPATAHQRLVRAAAMLFLSRGFSKVTMEEIASELGMSKKTIYRLYPAKEALLLAAIDAFFDDLSGSLDAVLDAPELTFPVRVSQVLATLGRRVTNIQAAAVQDIRRTAPDGWRRMDERRRGVIVTRLARLLQAGRDDGMVRPDLPPDLLVLILLALIDRVAHPDTLTELPVSITDVFRTVTTVFFEGVLTDSARAAPPPA